MAKNKEQKLAVVDEKPAYLTKHEGTRGQENVSIDDVTIPRLDVIQDISPQRKKKEPEYIEGAEEGILFNSVTNMLYGTTVAFVPVYYRKEFVVWKDRKKGGGFFGSFETMAEAEAEANKLGDDFYAQDVGQHFGLIIRDDSSVEEIVCSMSRSKMKASRQLNTLVKLGGGDRFSRAYTIKAFADTNKNGDNFFNIGIDQLGYVSEEIYRVAEKMYNSIVAGRKDVVREEAKGKVDDETSEY